MFLQEFQHRSMGLLSDRGSIIALKSAHEGTRGRAQVKTDHLQQTVEPARPPSADERMVLPHMPPQSSLSEHFRRSRELLHMLTEFK